ncbi:MAG: SRPBCC domain-containing protein [Galactobacter sp.]
MPRTDRASVLIHRESREVFAALTQRDALESWLPPQGMRGRFEDFDMRAGGSFRLILTYQEASGRGKTTADSDVSEVHISALVPDELVVWDVAFESEDPAYRGTMSMQWRFRRVESGTDVQITALNVPEGISARDHAKGLTSSLANLAAHLEG